MPFTCRVEPENVAVSVLKPPGYAPGMVLRIFETAGEENTLAQIHVPSGLFTSARLLNLVEEDVGPVVYRNDCLKLHLRPYELATVKFSR
jgi:alpha-mannosidase